MVVDYVYIFRRETETKTTVPNQSLLAASESVQIGNPKIYM